MDWVNQLNFDKFIVFTLVLTRVSSLTMTAPIYGSTDAPMRVRALLALALAVLIMPSQWNAAAPEPGNLLNYLVFVGGELIVGTCLGFGIMILVHGMELAGEIIGYVGGLMIAEAYDPTSDMNTPILSRLFTLVSLSIFVCIGGHRLVMAGLLDTFRTIPPGSGVFSRSIADAFVTLMAQSFSLGIRAAAPATIALLLATLVLGLISRTVPQLNVLILGFGLNSLLIFGALALTLGGVAWAFQEQIEPALEVLLDALHTPMRVGWLS
ncbi:MAG: flagellar biosynthetic protein FliR [Thermoguttaceae bacterium]|jgi:flagellar biosynthetic protein FliR